jgi:hypothetical protein
MAYTSQYIYGRWSEGFGLTSAPTGGTILSTWWKTDTNNYGKTDVFGMYQYSPVVYAMNNALVISSADAGGGNRTVTFRLEYPAGTATAFDLGSVTVTAAQANDWIWIGLQAVRSAERNTYNLWYKFGADGTMTGPVNATLEFSAYTGWIANPPGDYSQLNLSAATYATSYSYYFHATALETSTAPSNTTLNTIACSSDSAPSGTWADWLLDWTGSTNRADRSGNSRNWTSGTGHSGAAAPECTAVTSTWKPFIIMY